MISSASDYEWVNVTNPSLAGFISGNILPARDNRNDGSWRCLKYEDYLFLLEALMERANWDTSPSSTVTPGGIRLLASAMRGVMPTSSTAANYFRKDVALSTALIPTTASDSIVDAMNAAVTLETVTIGRPLKAESVRKIFWNMSLLERSRVALQWSDIATSWNYTRTYTKSDGSSSSNPPASNPGLLWAHGNATRVGSPYDAVSISYRSTFGTYPYADQAWLLVKLKTVLDSTSSSAGMTWYDVAPVACTVTNGVVSVPNILGLAQTACTAHGVHYTGAAGYLTSGGGSVSVDSYLLVVKNAFPAEIDSLNWNWTPPSP